MNTIEKFNLSQDQHQQLLDHLRELLRTRSTLQQTVGIEQEKNRNETEQLFRELLDLFDSLEALINAVEQQPEASPKVWKRLPKNLKALRDRLTIIFSRRNVQQIDYTESKVDFKLCSVVETENNFDVEEGTILKIVKQGFQIENRILRPIEVITAKNS